MSRQRTVQCLSCEEPLHEDVRRCTNCGELQPSPMLAMLLGFIGVFGILVGVLLGAFTLGLSRMIGLAMVLVGFALVIGGYTSYLDAQAQRRRRAR